MRLVPRRVRRGTWRWCDRVKKTDDELTLQEAADILGVHYMTAYRYVRTGRLAAVQVGSKWHVRRSSLEQLTQPRAPGRARRGAHGGRHHYERQLTERLVEGDEPEAWRVTQQALESACTPEDLYLEVLGTALRHVGDEWEAGRLSVADEHRASAVMARLIGRLGPSLVRPGRKRGLVVLGAPEGDHHGLATALVADVLRGRGFAVTDLGPHTPPSSFAESIAGADRLVATGIVVSAPIGDAAIAATVAAAKSSNEAPLLLGGFTIRDEAHAHGLGADAWSDSARAAADWFDVASGR